MPSKYDWVDTLMSYGRKQGIPDAELNEFRGHVLRSEMSMQAAQTLMMKLIKKGPLESVVFRKSKSGPDGETIYASDHDLKAFPITRRTK